MRGRFRFFGFWPRSISNRSARIAGDAFAFSVFSLALLACAHPASPGWSESESHATQHHEQVAAVVPGKPLDPTTIDKLDEAALQAALTQLGDRAPAGQVALRAARLAHHRGDDALARSLLARAATATDAATVKDGAAALAGQLAADVAVDPAVIAVLLPLTGKFASIGSELRIAIELAPIDGAKLVFIDTKGDPDGAAAAVERASAQGATAILGPVGEREAIAAARAAAMRGIPIGLLAPADGAEPAAGVFRLVSSAADEARAVARIAREDSFNTVGVLAPRDDTGADEAEAFVAEAKQLGLEVTAQGTYDPTGGDLEPDVKAFLNLVPATNTRLAEHLAKHGKKGWGTFSPDIPFTLLYIPDRYDRAAIVAAFLPYFNVELRTTELPDPHMLMRKHGGRMPQVVQLVGSSGWHHPSLPIRGGPPVQGALIVDFFDGDLGGDAGTQFGTAFAARAGRPASTAAAQVHDAARIVFAARKLAANAADPRAAFRTALARAKLDDGACGASTIGPDGEIQRAATVLEVSGDELIVAP